MTDKEKLSAVRAEIEMRKESLKPHGGQGLVVTRLMRELCDDFLSFIDSIPEEPKDKCKGCNNVKGCITCVDGSECAHIEECNITGIKSKHATGKLKELVDNVSEEGLEEARKQLEEYSVSEALEEEIKRYLHEVYDRDDTVGDVARHFANWQKQQMVKDAISAKVTEIYYPTDSCLEIEATLPEDRFEDGDKVLIIKEE